MIPIHIVMVETISAEMTIMVIVVASLTAVITNSVPFKVLAILSGNPRVLRNRYWPSAHPNSSKLR